MATLEEFQMTKEFKLWNNLRDICDSLEINESKITSMKDLNDYWEPLLERIFKLGVLFKQNGKLKEIKMNWIRPIFCVETNDKIIIDGKTYEPTKESMDKASEVFRALRSLIAAIFENEKLDATNFKKLKKNLQDCCSIFFKALNIFVTKKFAQEMHQTIKLIIKPFRDLIKANYRLFLLERKEEGDSEMTMFQDKKDFKMFTDNLNNFFVDEENKLKRDIDMEQFEEFLQKNNTREHFQYIYYSKPRENYSNTENCSVKKQILQKKFEEGLQASLKYLYEKKKDDFYIEINVNKLFRNLELIPEGNSLKASKFYICQMQTMIREMKEKLFEIKMNGTTRIKMPVTENVEFIQRIKKIYDLHLLTDNLMGDRLKYDQFNFIYNLITFIFDSNLKEEISVFKEKYFMEDAIPKYIILSALKNSDIILNKMKNKKKEKNEPFNYDSFYQIKNINLGSEDNYIINAFELNESNKKFLTPQLEELKKTLNEEITEFGGRFWILEEFFNPEDMGLWLEAIELLKDINLTVQDDIRDFILTNYENSNRNQKVNVSEKNETKKELRKQSSNKLMSQKSVRKFSKENNKVSPVIKPKKPLSNFSKNNLNEKKNERSDSEDDSILISNSKNIANINLENIRPPFVWNFPIEIVQNKAKEMDKKPEIRNVDPKSFYKDGRIDQFLDLLTKIKNKMIEYCRISKPNKWLYFFENILKIHGITYNFPEKSPNIEDKNE